MNIKIAKSAGFCYGVDRAVSTAFKLCDDIQFKKTYTLGQIIHNSSVVDKISKKGIVSIENIDEIPNNSRVIIRAHGIPKLYYSILKNKNNEVIDATCTFVKKIHNLVEKHYNLGEKIIIIGKSTHPEVIGINGWCNNEAIIFDEIPYNITFDNSIKYYCVVQTTFSVEKYEKIIKYLINILNIFEFDNTICYTTKERQKEAELLSKISDSMIVIGDKKSSNTEKLFKIVSKYCKNSYFISNLNDLKKIKNINKIKNLGITAGASTPNELIEEVKKIMADQNNKTYFEEFIGKSQNKKTEMITDANKAKLLGKEIKMKVNSLNDNGYLLTICSSTKNFELPLPYSESDDDVQFNVGDEIKIFITKKDNDIIASRKVILEREKRNDLFKKIFLGEEFELKINEVVKNGSGLQGNFNGCTVFIPNSHVDIIPSTVKKLEKYIGKTIKVVYLPDVDENNQQIKPTKRNIKASHKLIIEAEKAEINKKFWEKHEIGDVVIGKVVKIVEFGAFVEVDKKDCLVPISLLAWYKLKSVKEILKQDKTYEFIIDPSSSKEDGKVILNYRELQLKPEDIISVKYVQGTVVTGKVATITDKAMFVNLEPGIDGRVSISEISNKFIKDINELYKVGDTIEAVVTDNDENKVKLSIKLLLLNKENNGDSEISEVKDEVKKEKKTKKKEVKKEEVLNFIDETENVTLGAIKELEDLLK